ncbi:MAG: gephyrin-like molybdotransferase Glp [Bryobacteraceae bacterium]
MPVSDVGSPVGVRVLVDCLALGRYNGCVPALTVPEARRIVENQVLAHRLRPAEEDLPLDQAAGRVLARDAVADRNYPPLPRSVRDGFAVRAVDVPGRLRVAGEVRAGERYSGRVEAGECVEIMTGAPVPDGADAIIMVEHTTRDGEFMLTDRSAAVGDFINPVGAEATAGDCLIAAGQRLDYARVALLAMAGIPSVRAFARPAVAILATGDEIVEVHEAVADHQIRNSNAYSLAVQVRRAGGLPTILPVARDTVEDTTRLVECGLDADLLLLSGGVSAGKYDVVETVLANLGGEFFFDRVLIQPGQPLVFGRARGRFFFGLPGNPASTMVTFEVFARAALELLAGQTESRLVLTRARLTRDLRHRAGLTRFLPAWVEEGELTPIPWAGSGDIAALARSNAFLVAEPDRPEYRAGDEIKVLLR